MKLNNASIFSYADDTAIVFTGNDWDAVRNNAERGISTVAKWLRNNLLTLNTAKTNYICFSIQNHTQPGPNFCLRVHSCLMEGTDCDCPCIDRTDSVKYLGVMVDQRLSWYPHLDLVAGRVRKLIWMFKTLRHVVPR